MKKNKVLLVTITPDMKWRAAFSAENVTECLRFIEGMEFCVERMRLAVDDIAPGLVSELGEYDAEAGLRMRLPDEHPNLPRPHTFQLGADANFLTQQELRALFISLLKPLNWEESEKGMYFCNACSNVTYVIVPTESTGKFTLCMHQQIGPFDTLELAKEEASRLHNHFSLSQFYM